MRLPSPRAPLLALLVGAISTLLAGASRVKVQSGEVDHEGRPTVELSIDPAEGFTCVPSRSPSPSSPLHPTPALVGADPRVHLAQDDDRDLQARRQPAAAHQAPHDPAAALAAARRHRLAERRRRAPRLSQRDRTRAVLDLGRRRLGAQERAQQHERAVPAPRRLGDRGLHRRRHDPRRRRRPAAQRDRVGLPAVPRGQRCPGCARSARRVLGARLRRGRRRGQVRRAAAQDVLDGAQQRRLAPQGVAAQVLGGFGRDARLAGLCRRGCVRSSSPPFLSLARSEAYSRARAQQSSTATTS